jgi:glycerol uptake facilitator-like aquaporin
MTAAAPLRARLLAEGLGTALLVTAVVGSGIMAERLSGGNAALALLCNTVATGAALVALIFTFGPVSGAHFNPAVSLSLGARGELAWRDTGPYAAAQCLGAVCGSALAHAMFALPLLSLSTRVRAGLPQLLAEAVASFGLILVIVGGSRRVPLATPLAVAAWITGAYWFTASTSFANPAVTLGRALSDTFAGIRPLDVPGFVLAQLAGAGAAVLVSRRLLGAQFAQGRS